MHQSDFTAMTFHRTYESQSRLEDIALFRSNIRGKLISKRLGEVALELRWTRDTRDYYRLPLPRNETQSRQIAVFPSLRAAQI